MKKAMAILLAAVLALACTACGGSKNGETKDRLAQIKEKRYGNVLKDYTGNLLLVGINYDKTAKKHECLIEKAEKLGA